MKKFTEFMNEGKTPEQTLKAIKKELGKGSKIEGTTITYAAPNADIKVLSFLNGNTKGQRVSTDEVDGYTGELWYGQNIEVKKTKDYNYTLTIK